MGHYARTHNVAPQTEIPSPESQGKSLTPPPFQLTAEDGGGKDKEPDYSKEPKIGPFTRTDGIKGPIAEQGPGDAHAFASNDVSQGNLGDCYLMASLLSLAGCQPETLKNNIRQDKDGAFTVKLAIRNKKGDLEWHDIKVDPIFVTDREGQPRYAKLGDGGELWAMVYEKAYAQLKGAYKKIDGGEDIHAMEALTCRVADTIDLSQSDEEEILESLLEAKRDKMPVTASTWNERRLVVDENGEEIPDVVPGHSYGVVDCDRKSKTITLVNPWEGGVKIPLSMKTFMSAFQFISLQSKF